ncbi:MAG: MBL fold metallo-hydrolase [Gemmatimonadetes bacterium]|uniref:MBL fold metallo-hydrolase n=1 Tax=Candidatus Kutchimonas denitrificans TaxID=3056748 RepID=A0AAE5CBX2_9BACT|nr:MBL fold metallo-hydrolase [Gemmatimonadota bacterium]NIR74955.1 MBL fold metallo-hydrolase [Candidatus Kutchimonas denitrificans]NIS00067.1 MBL fold metallo-hydrolase [Gemmatimonadota bacterium]NIT65650.1 MBL fold metallo-hydrolase [Gemmatimonadota bacterium]NIU52620.1 MBL fold metallo-hydrolase [Gemmatimonadota bacterium]
MGEPDHRRVDTLVADNPSPLTLDGTRTYVLGPEPCLVVDPGPALADHLDAIEVRLGSLEVAAICITHYHPDHAAGAADLVLRLAAPLAATPESARAAGLEAPEIPLDPGSVVPFGGGRLVPVPAPGHCPDHVCFHWPEAAALFAGDIILGEGTSMIAPPEGNMAAYMKTLERLAALELEIIYPGHGPPVENPAEKLDEYVRHRLERERQVLDALADGAATPVEIRARVYPGLDPSLERAAEGSVLAHLAKLVDEGRVEAAGEKFSLKVR